MTLAVGMSCTFRKGEPVGQQGERVTVLELLPGDRVRVAYSDEWVNVTDLIVPPHMLELGTAAARATDPWTSHAAATRQTPVKLSEAKRAILDAFVTAGDRGLNDFELEALTGRKQTSWGVRRGEMTNREGLLRANGETRASDTGSPAKVHVVTALGLEVWRELHKRGAA